MKTHQDGAFWASGELERVDACPGCGGKELAAKYVDLDDLLAHVPGAWSFDECRTCQSLCLNPRPARAVIGKAYECDYTTHTSSVDAHQRDNGISLIWRLANDYMNRRFGSERVPASKAGRWLVPLLLPLRLQLDYFYRHLPRKSGRLLDIGCGNGAFLLRAQEAGWCVEGLEPDPAASARAREAGVVVHPVLPDAFHSSELFDRVTLSHVFEHVHEPRELLAHCHRFLRQGGVLWMSLPHIEGIGHRLYGRNWFALDPPRHLFLPAKAMLEQMLRDAGFTQIEVKRVGRGAARTFLPSQGYATARGSRGRLVKAWIGFVDIAASLFRGAAEEIVITARKA